MQVRKSKETSFLYLGKKTKQEEASFLVLKVYSINQSSRTCKGWCYLDTWQDRTEHVRQSSKKGKKTTETNCIRQQNSCSLITHRPQVGNRRLQRGQFHHQNTAERQGKKPNHQASGNKKEGEKKRKKTTSLLTKSVTYFFCPSCQGNKRKTIW